MKNQEGKEQTSWINKQVNGTYSLKYSFIIKAFKYSNDTESVCVLVAQLCPIVAQSCPTLCNTMDCSQPGFSVQGILQARVLE